MIVQQKKYWNLNTYLRTLFHFIFIDFLPPNVQYKKWTLATVRSRARGPDLAECAGLVHGRDQSYCIASEQQRQKG